MSESEIQKEIIEYCKKAGHEPKRMNRGRRGHIQFGFKGMPDLLVYVGNIGLWIEVKDAKGKLNDDQLEFEAFCRLRDIPHAVCRSLNDAICAITACRAQALQAYDRTRAVPC